MYVGACIIGDADLGELKFGVKALAFGFNLNSFAFGFSEDFLEPKGAPEATDDTDDDGETVGEGG